MRSDGGKERIGGRGLVWIPVLFLVISLEGRTSSAQDRSGRSLAISTASDSGTEESGAASPASSRGPDLVRVPPPSGHLSRFGPGATFVEKESGSASSRSWWLGSTGIALVLAVCGAICIAARRYRPQDSAGLVRVVGRVSLTPRHSIFVVQAGPRALLIGTGTQGAPTLLGELTETDQAGGGGDLHRAGLSRSGTGGDRPLEAWNQVKRPVVDLRLEDEE